ncbi:polysaccharide deacetylase family protein [Paraglaciecola sp. L1A13]|uniref:polysaccharide deacetylase family protein n=1 Tax=Paraglaciecola sp. L1A13 TaxID=2686359 RepID=UPI00131BD7FB|nr:polysaccharide deacetylase family protein [Paraglaciecola sp. L1A13]
MDRIIFCILVCTCIFISSSKVQAADNAVILLYHHVSNTTPASTSVTPQTFTQHMNYLAEHYNVLPLKDIIVALQKKRTLPDNAIAITFDDGFKNIYQNGHPIMAKLNLPYTVFINPDLVNKVDYHLSWDDMRNMAKQGASFANHNLRHEHMLNRLPDESDTAWLARRIADIQQAEALLEENLDVKDKFFAYPYGEFSPALQARLTELGYVGFAQSSGAIASYSDFSALSRFPAAGIYANLDRLKVKMASLAMPVTNVSPTTPLVDPDPFVFQFSVQSDDINNSQLACYFQGNSQAITREGERISIAFTQQLPLGRSRVNCTAPSKRQPSRYYWYSKPWFVPTTDGKWLD